MKKVKFFVLVAMLFMASVFFLGIKKVYAQSQSSGQASEKLSIRQPYNESGPDISMRSKRRSTTNEERIAAAKSVRAKLNAADRQAALTASDNLAKARIAAIRSDKNPNTSIRSAEVRNAAEQEAAMRIRAIRNAQARGGNK